MPNPIIEGPRWWVNWSSEVQLHGNPYDDTAISPVAVVDEQAGGEVAWFSTEDAADAYCELMNNTNGGFE